MMGREKDESRFVAKAGDFVIDNSDAEGVPFGAEEPDEDEEDGKDDQK